MSPGLDGAQQSLRVRLSEVERRVAGQKPELLMAKTHNDASVKTA